MVLPVAGAVRLAAARAPRVERRDPLGVDGRGRFAQVGQHAPAVDALAQRPVPPALQRGHARRHGWRSGRSRRPGYAALLRHAGGCCGSSPCRRWAAGAMVDAGVRVGMHLKGESANEIRKHAEFVWRPRRQGGATLVDGDGAGAFGGGPPSCSGTTAQ